MPSARDYEELRKLINNRRIELRLRMTDVDVDAELQSGYFAKLMCGLRNLGPKSLGKVLGALGVEIVLMPISLADERRRDDYLAKRLAEMGTKGGRITRSRYTIPEWSKFCRRAAIARWEKEGKAKSVRKHNKVSDAGQQQNKP